MEGLIIELPLWSSETDVYTKKSSNFWYWRDPRWISSWDAPGSTNILQKSDGILVRSLAGARPASRTVCPRSRNHSGNHCKSKCVPPLSKVLSLWWRVRSHLTTRRSRMYSASRQPLASHRIGHGTVALTCCLRLNSQRVEFTLCPSQRARQWKIRSRRLSNKDSSGNRHTLLPPAFSSWVK